MVQVQQRFLAVFALAALWVPVSLPAQKFYPDDPLWRDPKPISVGKVKNRKINEYFDFFQNTFWEPDKQEIKHHDPPPSQAVNTLGEVPDSAWYTNRIGSRVMSMEELTRGPDRGNAPAADKPWHVVSGKNEGVTPGLVVRDSAGRRYFLKFDPKTNPEMASAADVLGSKFFYALGYNVPENYIVYFDRKQLVVNQESKYTSRDGHERGMTDRDVDDVLRKVPRDKEGRYRGIASLAISGDLIGPFRYYGTRTDDPNDVTRHEHRRDLRGLYVFSAWLNHTDSKSINSMDSVVDENGLCFVKHFLLDFGAILGSDSFEAKSPRAGHVYLFDLKPAETQFLSLGMSVPEWMRAEYPHIPEIGHLDYATFDPEKWKNNYPNPAFDLRTAGDTYWAAKKVLAFSDEAIRAIVATAQYSNPSATEWTVKCLIERRNKIGQVFLNDVLPLDNFGVRGGQLSFDDLQVKYGYRGPRHYSIEWSEFDNRTGKTTPLPRAKDFSVPRSATGFLTASIRAEDLTRNVRVYLRGTKLVGIERS